LIPKQIFRFCLVGVLSATVQFGILTVFLDFFTFSLNFSVTSAYVGSVFVHFFGNKYFTFRNAVVANVAEGGRYIGMVLLNYAVTLCVVGVLGNKPYVATVLSIVATVWVGFMLSKYWVFKK